MIGFVSQSNVSPDYLTFTPGISMDQKNDGKGQTYRDIDKCDSDIFIVGRGIVEAENVVETAKHYMKIGFEKWQRTLDSKL